MKNSPLKSRLGNVNCIATKYVFVERTIANAKFQGTMTETCIGLYASIQTGIDQQGPNSGYTDSTDFADGMTDHLTTDLARRSSIRNRSNEAGSKPAKTSRSVFNQRFR